MYVSMCVSYVRERRAAAATAAAASLDGEPFCGGNFEKEKGDRVSLPGVSRSPSLSLLLVLHTSSTCPPPCLATDSWRDRALRLAFGRLLADFSREINRNARARARANVHPPRYAEDDRTKRSITRCA